MKMKDKQNTDDDEDVFCEITIYQKASDFEEIDSDRLDRTLDDWINDKYWLVIYDHLNKS